MAGTPDLVTNDEFEKLALRYLQQVHSGQYHTHLKNRAIEKPLPPVPGAAASVETVESYIALVMQNASYLAEELYNLAKNLNPQFFAGGEATGKVALSRAINMHLSGVAHNSGLDISTPTPYFS